MHITHKNINQSITFISNNSIEIKDFDWYIPLCALCLMQKFVLLSLCYANVFICLIITLKNVFDTTQRTGAQTFAYRIKKLIKVFYFYFVVKTIFTTKLLGFIFAISVMFISANVD